MHGNYPVSLPRRNGLDSRRECNNHWKKEMPGWRLNQQERTAWIEKASSRLLDACRFVAQAEIKLRDGRRPPQWLQETLGLPQSAEEPAWLYRWDDLRWTATRSRPGAGAGHTDEDAVEVVCSRDGNASPIAKWEDGAEWHVPNITSQELAELHRSEAKQYDICFVCFA